MLNDVSLTVLTQGMRLTDQFLHRNKDKQAFKDMEAAESKRRKDLRGRQRRLVEKRTPPRAPMYKLPGTCVLWASCPAL